MCVAIRHLINFDHLGVLWVHFSLKRFAKLSFSGYFTHFVYLSSLPLALSRSLVINIFIFLKALRAALEW